MITHACMPQLLSPPFSCAMRPQSLRQWHRSGPFNKSSRQPSSSLSGSSAVMLRSWGKHTITQESKGSSCACTYICMYRSGVYIYIYISENNHQIQMVIGAQDNKACVVHINYCSPPNYMIAELCKRCIWVRISPDYTRLV